MMLKELQIIEETAEFLRQELSEIPETALVLGTGLGYFADFLEEKTEIPYSKIPHFPVSTAPDHAGRLVCGKLCGKSVLIMQGRIHYYEGYSMDEVVYPIRVFRKLGIRKLFLTNAVGSINQSYHVGDLVLISDHIKFFNDMPLRGKNIDEFGPRFPDMSDAYSKELRAAAKRIAENARIPLREGIYAYMPGPCFETPAEIRMLRTLGADVVGMSTVPEVICAVHAGMKVLVLSFVTNLAAGMLEEIQELEYTEDSKNHFNRFITNLICADLSLEEI